MGEPSVQADDDAFQYKTGKVARLCSCRLSLLKEAYALHMADGTHNSRMKGVPA